MDAKVGDYPRPKASTHFGSHHPFVKGNPPSLSLSLACLGEILRSTTSLPDFWLGLEFLKLNPKALRDFPEVTQNTVPRAPVVPPQKVFGPSKLTTKSPNTFSEGTNGGV